MPHPDDPAPHHAARRLAERCGIHLTRRQFGHLVALLGTEDGRARLRARTVPALRVKGNCFEVVAVDLAPLIGRAVTAPAHLVRSLRDGHVRTALDPRMVGTAEARGGASRKGRGRRGRKVRHGHPGYRENRAARRAVEGEMGESLG